MSHPILHVVVCGFNHKKGCKVDYCYPPFPNSKSQDADDDLPKLWSNLASLAIPDGAHNSTEGNLSYLFNNLSYMFLKTPSTLFCLHWTKRIERYLELPVIGKLTLQRCYQKMMMLREVMFKRA